MEEHVDRFNRRMLRFARERWRLLLVVGGLLALVVATGAWLYAREAERRNLARARALLEQGELRSAQLLLEQAVQVKPGSITAQVALAEFMDEVGAPYAIERWQVVLQLAPGDAHQHRLAASALRHGELELARGALEAVTEAGRGTLEYHRLRAGLALARGDRRGATPHLESMVRLDPQNPRRRHALASHRLWLDEELETSRRELEELARAGDLRVRATLDLILDAPRRWPQSSDPEALLAARLFDDGRAVQLRATGRGGRSRLLAHVKALPLPEPADGAVLIAWLLRQDRAREAREWLELFSAREQSHPALAAPGAELGARLRDWPLLERCLRRGAWGVVSANLLRDAFSVHEQAPGGNRLRWQQLLEHPEISRGGLHVLWRLAELWGWRQDADRTLGATLRRFPKERWALEASRRSCLQRGSIDELLRLLADWEQRGGAPDEIRAERWLIPLLVGRDDAAILAGAVRFAEESGAHPGSRAVRALLLRREGRSGAALDLLERGRDPAEAVPMRWWLVYGVLLADAGRLVEAKVALGRVGGPLLPGEQALVDRVRATPEGSGR